MLQKEGNPRGPYDSFTPEERATLAKRAIDNGVIKTVVSYNREIQERTSKYSMSDYKRQLELCRRCTGVGLSTLILIQLLLLFCSTRLMANILLQYCSYLTIAVVIVPDHLTDC